MTSPLCRAPHQHPFRALSGPCPRISDHPIPPVETLWNTTDPRTKCQNCSTFGSFQDHHVECHTHFRSTYGLHQFFTNIFRPFPVRERNSGLKIFSIWGIRLLGGVATPSLLQLQHLQLCYHLFDPFPDSPGNHSDHLFNSAKSFPAPFPEYSQTSS